MEPRTLQSKITNGTKAEKEKYQNRLLKERERERERKERQKAEFFYMETYKEEDPESENRLLEILDNVKKEDGVFPFLKWLKSKFEEALMNRQSKSGNFCFSEPEEWGELLKKETMTKFVEEMEVKIEHKNWCIPESMTDYGLKHKAWLIEITMDEIAVTSSKFYQCQICKFDFKVLALHLSKSKECKEKYSEMDLEELKHAQKVQKKNMISDNYNFNKESIKKRYQERKKELAEKYLENKEETAIKKAEYYKKNTESFRMRNSTYYAKHREEILKKRAEDYKNKKATSK